jgi:hypothetical protein
MVFEDMVVIWVQVGLEAFGLYVYLYEHQTSRVLESVIVRQLLNDSDSLLLSSHPLNCFIMAPNPSVIVAVSKLVPSYCFNPF